MKTLQRRQVAHKTTNHAILHEINLPESYRNFGVEPRHEPGCRDAGRHGVKVERAPRRKGYDRLWLWFGLGRASWITLPRVLVHEMPDEWQNKMAALLEEYEETYTNWEDGIGTRVQITDHGKLTSLHKWLNDYRHPAQGKIETLKSK